MNLCIITSLYFLGYLINKIINPVNDKEKNVKSKKLPIFSNGVIGTVFLFIVMVVLVCFTIA